VVFDGDATAPVRLRTQLWIARNRMKKKKATKSPRRAASTARVLDLDILPELLGYNVRRAQIALWRDFLHTVAEGEIRPGMFSAIVLVRANPGISQIELAKELGIDKATMVGLTDRLEDAGWILRKRSREDRRRHGLTVTSEGQKIYRELKREMIEHERKFVELFNATERKQLIALLQRLHARQE
jgi:DNA-binding MarR family transcriptional regulator